MKGDSAMDSPIPRGDETRFSRRRPEETEQQRQMNAAAAPHIYIERGISRRPESSRNLREQRRRVENAPLDNPLAEYREARLREEADRSISFEPDERDDDQPQEDNRSSLLTDGSAVSLRQAAARRFTRRTHRELAEGEEPPLIDTLAEAVEERYSSRRDFRDRYHRSSAGASIIRRESDKGGSVVREVEYFVPKISGDNAAEINYGQKKARRARSRNLRPMRGWQKAGITTLSLLLVFVVLLGGAFSILLNRMNFVGNAQAGQNALSVQNMEADKELQQAADGVDDSAIELPTAVMFDADIENILLIGSDRRSMDEDGRSDAMMMLTIDRKHKKIKMTSFLRDLYIKIPGKYGTRLNSAYSVGGVDLLKQTVEANLGITVDRYIIVDFTAFKTVVNKIGKLNGKGGIKITVTSAEANYMCHHEKYGLFPRFEKGKGTYYMNGAEALNYARIRKIDSDFGRTKRQRKVLTEIINELKGLGYMDLISIGYACLEYVTTDFTKAELVGLASEAPAVMNYGNAQISIPVKGSYTTQHMSNGNEVLAANLTVNAQILGDFIYNDDMKYEGNNKEVRGIYLPDLKGIANSNVTTKHDTESTTSADTTGTTAAQTHQTTKKAAKTSKSSKTTAKKTTSSAANPTTTTPTTAIVAVG